MIKYSEDSYVENTVTKLVRKYSKDELVSFLNKRVLKLRRLLKEALFNNGQLISEIDYLKEENKKLQNKLDAYPSESEIMKEAHIKCMQDKNYISIKNQVDKGKSKMRTLRKTISELLNENIKLKRMLKDENRSRSW